MSEIKIIVRKKKKSENKIEAEVCKYAEKCKMMTYKLHSEMRPSWPDRMFVTLNEVFYVEFKTPVGRLDKKQKSIMAKLLSRNIGVYLIRSVVDGKALIDNIISKNKIKVDINK